MNTNPSAVQGIVIQTAIKAGNTHPQHAEGIVVSTKLTAGEHPGLATNHAEGLVG